MYLEKIKGLRIQITNIKINVTLQGNQLVYCDYSRIFSSVNLKSSLELLSVFIQHKFGNVPLIK